MNSHNITIRFLTLLLPLLFLAQCSADQAAIPKVGESFCTDRDGDTFAGFYTRVPTDEVDVIRALTLVTCLAPYDCNDDPNDSTATSIFPDAVEIADNGVDEDCDASDFSLALGDADDDTDCEDGSAFTTYYLDADLDGYGGSTTLAACELPTGYVSTSTDCNDTDNGIHPDATDNLDDGIDQDCSGADAVACEDAQKQSYYLDTDLDGYRADNNAIKDCTRPTGNYFLLSELKADKDCDDSKYYTNPGMSGKDYGYLVYQQTPGARNIPLTAVQVMSGPGNNHNSPNLSIPFETVITSTHTLEATFTNALGLPEPTDGKGVITNNFLDENNDCDDKTDEDGRTQDDYNSTEIAQIIDGYSNDTGIYFNQCPNSDGENAGAFNYYTDLDTDGFGDDAAEAAYQCHIQEPINSNLASNNTDCEDEIASINQSVTSDYSNYNGEIYLYAGYDNNCNGEIDETSVTDESPEWHFLAGWNGLSVSATDDATWKNTSHSYIGNYYWPSEAEDNGHYDSTNYTVSSVNSYTLNGRLYYNHGIEYDFNFSSYFTAIHMNDTYGDFWINSLIISNKNNNSAELSSGKTSLHDFSCNSDSECNGILEIDLNKTDVLGNSISSTYYKGRKAVVFSNGYVLHYTNSDDKDDNQNMNDQYFEFCTIESLKSDSCSDGTIPDDGIIYVRFLTNMNGQNPDENIKISLPFSILVYDPYHIKAINFDEARGFIETDSNNYQVNQIETHSVSLLDLSPPVFDSCNSASGCWNQKTTIGTLTRSWGFVLNDSFEIHKLTAVGFLSNWQQSSIDDTDFLMTVTSKGSAYRMNAGLDSEIKEAPNKMQNIVLICANTNVCEMEFNGFSYNGFGGDYTWQLPLSTNIDNYEF